MAPKKKAKKSQRKRTKGTSPATKATNKQRQRKRVIKVAARKKSTKKKTLGRKTSSGARAVSRIKNSAAAEREILQEIKSRNQINTAKSASRQGGDLQGLSRAEQADSESVDELVEEGNPFEAGAVAGVEKADDEDEREVRTQELPEDDVPEEYREEE